MSPTKNSPIPPAPPIPKNSSGDAFRTWAQQINDYVGYFIKSDRALGEAIREVQTAVVDKVDNCQVARAKQIDDLGKNLTKTITEAITKEAAARHAEVREEVASREKVAACVSQIKVDIGKLQVKAGVWGGVGGLLIATVALAWYLLKG